MNSNPAFASLLRIRVAVLLALAAGGSLRLRSFRLASLVRLAVGLVAMAVATPSAHAQRWSGSVSGNWSNALNWSPNAPATGNALTWNASSTANLTSFNDVSNLSVVSLDFTGAPAGVVLNGNELTLTSGGSTAAIKGGSATINLDLNLITGTAPRLVQGAGADIVINGIIRQASGSEPINAAYQGTLTLNGANTYGGTTIVGATGGTLIVNTLKNAGVAQSTGTGSLIQLGSGASNAILVYTGAATSTDKSFRLGTNDGSIALPAVYANGYGALTWNGTQTLASSATGIARTFTLGGFNSDANTWNSAIQNNVSSSVAPTALTKEGTGQWILKGANTFTGRITANSGRLVLDYSNNDVLSTANALTLGGGTLEFKGAASGTTAETLGAVTVTGTTGMSSIVLNKNGGSGVNLTLGSTSLVATSLVSLFFDLGDAANSVKIGNNLTTTSTSMHRYILKDGSGRVDFASNNGSAANALSQINSATDLVAAPLANTNYRLTTSGTITGSATLNTLRIDPTADNQTLTLNQGVSTANTGMLAIMMTGSNNFTITQAAGQTGSLGDATTAAAVITIYHYGTGRLILDTKLGGNSTAGTGAVQFFGTGLVDWTKAANSSGQVMLDGVTLRQTSATGQLLGNGATGFGSGNIVLNNGGVWEISGGGSITRNIGTTAGAIQWNGDGGFSAFNGNATVNLGGGAITWGTTANFVKGNNALVLSSSNADSMVDFQNNINFGSTQRVVRVNNGSAAVDAVLSGILSSGLSGGLVKEGVGTLNLTGVNTYTGATTVNAGTLALSGSGTLGTSTLTITGGTLDMGGKSLTNTFNSLLGGTLANGTLTNNGSNFDLQSGTVSASLAGTNGVNKTTSSTVTLSGNNTYSGATTISAGTLEIGSAGRLGGGSYTQNIANNGTFIYSGANSQTLSGVISGSGALTQNNSASTLTLSSNNTYTGTTTISAGTLEITSTGRLGGGSYAQNISNNGTFIYSGASSQTLSGAISGSGALTQNNSASTLTLSGNNTYSGPTTVNAGTLSVVGSVASSAVAINNGGVLTGNGTTGALTITSGASINPGVGVGTINTGGVTLNGGGIYNWQLLNAGGTAGSGWDLLSSTGALTIGAGSNFTINISTVSDQAGTAGSASNFLNSQNYSWRLAEFGSAISGFGPNFFTLNSTGFQNSLSGNFSLEATGNFLNLLYTTTLASYSYTAGTGNWSTPTNWTPNGTPTSGSALTINGTGGTSTNDLLSTVQSLNIASTAGAYTIAGSGNGSTITLDAGITNSSSNNQTISMGINLGADQTFQADAGNLVLSGALGTSNRTLTLDGVGNVSITNTVSGNGAILKNGVGTLTLAGSNTYTGATTINAGTLTLSGELSGSSVTVNGGLLNQTSAGSIAGTGTTFTLASGNATLAGTNTYTGATTVNGGTLTLSGGLNNSSVTVNGGALNQTSAGSIAGTGTTFTLTSGNATLAGTNTYTGATTISAGTLQIASTGRLGGGSYSEAITNNGTFIYSGANNQSLAGIISGSGALTQNNSSSTLTLSGNNTYTGATTVSLGVLNIQHANALGATAGSTTVSSGAALQLQGDISVGAEALSLAGTGNGSAGTGALRNISGSNTYGGAITLTGATHINSDADLLTLSGGIGGATQNLTIGGSGNTTISGAIGTTTGTLTKDGLGTLSLNATNTYTGATTINAGTLQTLTANVISDSSAVSVASGASFVVGGSDTVASIAGAGNITLSAGTLTASSSSASVNTTFSGVISGSGLLAKRGASTLVLSGNNTFSGGVDLGGTGSILIGHDNAFGSGNYTFQNSLFTISSDSASNRTISNKAASGSSLTGSQIFGIAGTGGLTFADTTTSVNLGNGERTLQVNNTFTQFNAALTNGGVTKAGTGTLILNGNNTYVSATRINSGTLQIGAGGLTGTLNATSTITNNATLTFNRSGNITQGTHFSNNITGTGNLIQAGSGNLTLSSNNNTYTGTTSVLDGTLILSGTLSNSSVIVNGASAALNQTSTGSIGGTGATFTLTDGNATLNGANTYTGTTTLSGGTLQVGNTNALGSGGNITFSGGAMSFSSNGAAADYGTRIKNSTSAIVLDTNGQSVTFGAIDSTNTNGLTKNGTGTLTLSGANAYTGATTINAGTLNLTGDNADSATTVNNGGTLIGTGTAGAVTVNSLGTIVAGNAAGTIGTLTVGSLTLNGGSTYTWDFGNISGTAGTEWDLLSVTNALTINATSGDKFTVAITGTPTGWAPSTTQTWNIINYGSLNAFDDSVFAYTTSLAGAGTWSFTNNTTSKFIGLTYSVSPTSTWTGGSGNWDSGFNTQPLNGNALVFSGAGGTATNNIASGNLTSLTTITINSGAGSYTLAANSGTSGFDAATPLTITGVTNNSANATTVNLALALSSSPLSINAAAGNITMGGPIANNNAITFSGDNSTTVSGAISGTGAINKNGNGSLTLTTTNTYAGATTINAGTLQITGSGSLGTSASYAGAISNNGTFTLNTTTDQTLSGIISGSGALVKSNTNNLTLSGANTYTGGTSLIGGMVVVGSNTAFGNSSGAVTVNPGAGNTITLQSGVASLSISNNFTLSSGTAAWDTNSNTTIVSGAISGFGALTKNGLGTLTLSGQNSYTGATTISAGTLTLSGGLNNSSVILSAGTLNQTSAGTIAGTGTTFTLTSGNATLAGANTYTGGTTLNGGTLNINNSGSGGTSSAIGTGTLTIAGGTIDNTSGSTVALSTNNTQNWNGDFAFTGTRDLNLGTGAVTMSASRTVTVNGGNLTVGGIIGAGTSLGLTKNGTGTLILSANNTYTGATAINAGTLQLGGGSTSTSGMVAGNIVNNGALVFSRNNTMTFSGNISGSGSLTLGGGTSSSLTLSGNNTYTGGTTIANSAGSTGIVLGANNALGNGTLTLGNGSVNGRFLMRGYNQTITGLSTGASNTLSLIESAGTTGGSTSTLTINLASGNTSTTGSNFYFRDGANSGKLALVKTGAGTLDFSVFNTAAGAMNYSGGLTVNEGTFTYSSQNNTAALGNSTAGGIITLGGGTLNYNGTAGSSVTIANNMTLTASTSSTLNNANGTVTVTGTISGSGNLIKTGAGTVTLSGTNTYTGNTTVTLGTLALGANNTISDSSNLIINGGTFDISSYSDTVGVITMTNGNLTGTSGVLTGSSYNITGGTVTAQLSGGTITINDGTTQIGAVGSTVALNVSGSSAVANLTANVSAQSVSLNNGGSITGSFSLNQTGGVTANSGSIASNIIGTGGVTMNGAGNTLTLSGINTYTGATTLSAGNISINSVSALGSTSGVNLANATALIYTGGAAATLDRAISVTSGTGTIRNNGGALTLTGGLTKNGTTLTLDSGTFNVNTVGISGSAANSDLIIDGATVNLNVANTYNGPTSIIDGGTLNANVADALPTANGRTAISIDATGTGSSTLALGASQSVASLTGAASSNVTLGSNTLTVGTTSGSTTYAGRISGTGNLVKDGASTQVLNGENTFTGTTTVNGTGTLTAATANALGGTTTIDVNGGSLLVAVANAVNSNANINLGGGTLAVSGNFNENVGALTLSADSIIDFSGFSGTLRFSGLSWASTSPNAKLAIWNWSGTTEWGTQVNNYTNPSNLVFSNSANLTADNLAKISFYSDSGFNSIGSGFIESDFDGPGTLIIAVPETETYITAIILLLGATVQYLRHRAKRKALEGHRLA